MGTAPTHDDLAEIETEWPLIAAEIALVETEIRLANFPDDALSERAHRRAVRALLALIAQQTSTTAGHQSAAA